MENESEYNVIPQAEVKDQEAYERYQKLSQHPILNKMSKMVDSKGRTLNLGMTVNNLRKNIADLPKPEQQKFLVLKQKHYEIMCRRNGAKRQAYKVIVNKEGVDVNVAIDKLEIHRLDLIEMFGKMFTCKEVHQMVLENYHLKGVSIKQIENFKSTYLPEINSKIEEHKRSFSDIRLGYKRSRLEELSWMYMKRKRIYQITNKPDDHRLLLQTIEQIRKEAEGDMLRIDGNLGLSMETNINSHIKNELLQFINLKEIIIARVAAKANISALMLIESMSRSFYQAVIESPEPLRITEYPSMQTYDFDKIKRINDKKDTEKQLQQSKPPETHQISTEKVKKAEDIKSILLAKLAERNGDVNLAKNNITSALIEKTNNL